MFSFETPISQLSIIGKRLAKQLKNLNLEKAQDLLFYYPFRYEDFSQVSTINKLQPGTTATIKGRIEFIHNKRSPIKRKIITEALITDSTGTIKAIWFSQPFLTKSLTPNVEVYLSGKVEVDYYGLLFNSPSYEKIPVQKKETLHTARLVPIYSLTEKLTQKQIRYLIKLTLPLVQKIKDWLPFEIRQELKLYDLSTALKEIHFPSNKINLEKARHRLKFEELFLIQLQAQGIKFGLQKTKAYPVNFKEEKTKEFVNSLPFKLTDTQRKTAWQILKDLQKDHPMNRLLEGEVGSGKTIVAIIAILNVVLNNYQVVFMVPTEILAKQHFETISKLLKRFNFTIGLLTRTEKKIFLNQSESILKKVRFFTEISAGKIDILIGTHALLEENIHFKKLALIIIDEQHRFGVIQRSLLFKHKTKLESSEKISPHYLSMTATPIPRSLALTLYGDLDLSIVNELPRQRKEIITKIINPQDRQKAYNFIREEIKRGRQVFVICPLIDPSDKLGVKSAKDEYEKLKKEIFSDLKIGLLHSRLKSKEKEKVREEFLANKINILVATSVIEVGIDIPNASVMMIEGAERFGLAQLYQFRGRVGRSSHQSYCFLFTETSGSKTRQRLKALLTAKDCFELALKDLEIRGPGEIFGTQQSGYLTNLKIARLTDYSIIQEANFWAKKILEKDFDLEKYPALKEKLNELKNPKHLE